MAYGTIKIDTITFTDNGIDKSVAISGLVQNPTFTGNVTVTGTVSGNTVQGQTISGVTVTGTTANFTSGNFTNISGGTHTITSGVFASGTAANPSISFVSDSNTGIYSPGADQVAISTNGTGRLFVDSSGNVGIGTTSVNTTLEVVNSSTPIIRVGDGIRHMELRGGSTTQNAAIGTNYNGSFDIIQNGNPAVTIDSSKRVLVGTSSARSQQGVTPKLQVENTVYDGIGLVVNSNSSDTCPVVVMGKSRGAALNSSTIVQSGDRLGAIYVQGADGTDIESSAAAIEVFVDGTPGANDMPGRLVFSTTADGASSPTERMRITRDGYIVLDGSIGAIGMRAGSAGQLLLIADNGGLFHQAGGNYYLITTAGGSTSDATLKTNVQPIADSLDKLSQIRGVSFTFIEEPLCDADKGQQIGVIAQEVESVFPEAVVTGEDGIKAVRYDKLVAPLIEALKESKERIEALEAKVAALEAS